MKKLLIVLCVMLLAFVTTGKAKAEIFIYTDEADYLENLSEQLGYKTLFEGFENDAVSAGSSRGIPGVRFVSEKVPGECNDVAKIETAINDEVMNDIISALTQPFHCYPFIQKVFRAGTSVTNSTDNRIDLVYPLFESRTI